MRPTQIQNYARLKVSCVRTEVFCSVRIWAIVYLWEKVGLCARGCELELIRFLHVLGLDMQLSLRRRTRQTTGR